MFPFPILACLCSATSGLPPPATSLWPAGPLSGTTRVLLMGAHVLARMPAMALRSGESGRNGPPMQSSAHSLCIPEAGLAPQCPPPPGTAASLAGTGGGSDLAVVRGCSPIQDGGAVRGSAHTPELSSPRFQAGVCIRESCQGDLLVFSLLSSHLSGTGSCMSCPTPCTGSGPGRERRGRRERGISK